MSSFYFILFYFLKNKGCNFFLLLTFLWASLGSFLNPKRKKLVPLLCDMSHKHSSDVNQQWGTPDTTWNRPWYNPLPHDTMVFDHTNLDKVHRLKPSKSALHFKSLDSTLPFKGEGHQLLLRFTNFCISFVTWHITIQLYNMKFPHALLHTINRIQI
jgi:hypothetical protein